MAEPAWATKAQEEALQNVLGAGSNIGETNPLAIGILSLGESKADIIDTVSQIAPANLIPANITTSMTRPVIIRIHIAMRDAGNLTYRLIQGGTAVNVLLNGGGALTADVLYTFDTILGPNDAMNLRYSVASRIRVLKVVELKGV